MTAGLFRKFLLVQHVMKLAKIGVFLKGIGFLTIFCRNNVTMLMTVIEVHREK